MSRIETWNGHTHCYRCNGPQNVRVFDGRRNHIQCPKCNNLDPLQRYLWYFNSECGSLYYPLSKIPCAVCGIFLAKNASHEISRAKNASHEISRAKNVFDMRWDNSVRPYSEAKNEKDNGQDICQLYYYPFCSKCESPENPVKELYVKWTKIPGYTKLPSFEFFEHSTNLLISYKSFLRMMDTQKLCNYVVDKIIDPTLHLPNPDRSYVTEYDRAIAFFVYAKHALSLLPQEDDLRTTLVSAGVDSINLLDDDIIENYKNSKTLCLAELEKYLVKNTTRLHLPQAMEKISHLEAKLREKLNSLKRSKNIESIEAVEEITILLHYEKSNNYFTRFSIKKFIDDLQTGYAKLILDLEKDFEQTFRQKEEERLKEKKEKPDRTDIEFRLEEKAKQEKLRKEEEARQTKVTVWQIKIKAWEERRKEEAARKIKEAVSSPEE